MPTLSTSRTEAAFRFRTLQPGDGRNAWELARSAGLDENSPYAYILFGDHFSDTCLIAEHAPGAEGATTSGAEGPSGFVLGFRVPDEPDTLFVWQIGVADHARRRGLGAAMLDELVARTGVTAVEATVTPDNAASDALFRGLGARHGATVTVEDGYPSTWFPPGHDAELRYRIRPVGTPAVVAD